jgi:hypothetical protein
VRLDQCLERALRTSQPREGQHTASARRPRSKAPAEGESQPGAGGRGVERQKASGWPLETRTDHTNEVNGGASGAAVGGVNLGGYPGGMKRAGLHWRARSGRPRRPCGQGKNRSVVRGGLTSVLSSRTIMSHSGTRVEVPNSATTFRCHSCCWMAASALKSLLS